jgi:ribonuclease I
MWASLLKGSQDQCHTKYLEFPVVHGLIPEINQDTDMSRIKIKELNIKGSQDQCHIKYLELPVVHGLIPEINQDMDMNRIYNKERHIPIFQHRQRNIQVLLIQGYLINIHQFLLAHTIKLFLGKHVLAVTSLII